MGDDSCPTCGKAAGPTNPIIADHCVNCFLGHNDQRPRPKVFSRGEKLAASKSILKGYEQMQDKGEKLTDFQYRFYSVMDKRARNLERGEDD